MHNKTKCMSLIKGGKRRCELWAIVNGYCHRHQRKQDRGKTFNKSFTHSGGKK